MNRSTRAAISFVLAVAGGCLMLSQFVYWIGRGGSGLGAWGVWGGAEPGAFTFHIANPVAFGSWQGLSLVFSGPSLAVASILSLAALVPASHGRTRRAGAMGLVAAGLSMAALVLFSLAILGFGLTTSGLAVSIGFIAALAGAMLSFVGGAFALASADDPAPAAPATPPAPTASAPAGVSVPAAVAMAWPMQPPAPLPPPGSVGWQYAMSLCGDCRTPLVSGSRFCNHCGKPVPGFWALDCGRCRGPLSAVDRFCRACGQPASP
jgi:hypothetical protein